MLDLLFLIGKVKKLPNGFDDAKNNLPRLSYTFTLNSQAEVTVKPLLTLVLRPPSQANKFPEFQATFFQRMRCWQ